MEDPSITFIPDNAGLASSLGPFESREIEVNGITLHYVRGGSSEPLILIPGWPETWWSYHKIMPELAKHFSVVSLDIRGMGSSSKPDSGFRKKEIAADIAEMIRSLDLGSVHIAGHDIGAGVAYSFAANHRALTRSLIILDTPPVNQSIYKLPMLPVPGMFFPWWLAFNQVDELPEKLLAGRFGLVLDAIFDGLSVNPQAISKFDRAVFARTYDTQKGIRGSNGWYKAFPADIEDNQQYSKITAPVLGVGGAGFQMLSDTLPSLATDLQLSEIKNCGHFIQSEKPEELTDLIISFISAITDR